MKLRDLLITNMCKSKTVSCMMRYKELNKNRRKTGIRFDMYKRICSNYTRYCYSELSIKTILVKLPVHKLENFFFWIISAFLWFIDSGKFATTKNVFLSSKLPLKDFFYLFRCCFSFRFFSPRFENTSGSDCGKHLVRFYFGFFSSPSTYNISHLTVKTVRICICTFNMQALISE